MQNAYSSLYICCRKPINIIAMKHKIIILIVMLSTACSLCAQWHPEAQIDVNNIKTNLYGTGNFSIMRGGHNFEGFGFVESFTVPNNGDAGTIYSNTLWIAGLDDNDNIHCSAVRFNQVGEDYWSGPLRINDGSTDIFAVMDYHHVWKIKRSDIDAIINNTATEIPEDILTWPAHGNVEDGYAANLAPFVDTDNDGIYNPLKGDYPDILGDMALYCIYNDNYDIHSESGGEALGIELHCMLYGFNAPDDEKLNNTLFMRTWIYNRSQNNYNNVYIGNWTDFDIGYPIDDYIGCNVERGYYYGYNARAIDDGGGEPGAYGNNPPAQFVMILGGPNMTPDGIDNPKFDDNGEQLVNESINGLGFGDEIVDNERLGMCGFVYHSNDATIHGDPEIAEEYYRLLKSEWKNGDKMCYGGNGVAGSPNTTDIPCKFMYPHDSDPYHWGTNGINPGIDEWCEETAVNGNPNEYGDRRGLASSGPFNFSSGAVHVIDKAFVTYWPSITFDRDEMNEWADYIKNYFINNLNK